MDWQFRSFGITTGPERNYLEETADGPKLHAALFDDRGRVSQKGGKLTAFFDGISYYYTKIPASLPYFRVEARIRLDGLNPTLDGQEGFGLILRDSIGEDGGGDNCYMANSLSILAAGLCDQSGRKIRNCFGSRFVYDLKPSDVAANSAGEAVSVSAVFPGEPLHPETGKSYRFYLEKDEAGFHVGMPDFPGKEAHFPEPTRMLNLQDEFWYVGAAAARGCVITLLDIELKTGGETEARNPERYPMPHREMSFKVLRNFAPADTPFELPFLSENDGSLSLQIRDFLLERIEVKAGEIGRLEIPPLPEGRHEIFYVFSSGERMICAVDNITLRKIGESGDVIRVSPRGRFFQDGSEGRPLDLKSALSYAVPGMTIVLQPGTYHFGDALEIPFAADGTPDKRIRLIAEENDSVTVDFGGKGGPFALNGSFWTLKGFAVTGSAADRAGLMVRGSNNQIEYMEFYSNGNTGLQICGGEKLKKTSWPKHNEVSFCLSYDNADPGQNNADGFAAKLACGEGNRFKGSIAFNNIDDGWDLYNRIANGAIGKVEIEGCLSAFNGHNISKKLFADGNGFKLGGEGLAVSHRLSRSLALKNDADGITSNSNPAAVIEDCRAVFQGGRNFAVYGQGEEAELAEIKNCVSAGGAEKDRLPGALASDAVRHSDESPEKALQIWQKQFLESYPEAEAWLEKALKKLIAIEQ